MLFSACPPRSAFIGLALASAICCGAIQNASAQTIWFVDANAGGSNAGTSWADAFTDLQDALAATGGDDEIWVATGTYKPTGGADRTATFQLQTGVAIYGGFPTGGGDGTFEARDPDPATNGTVLSGDIDNDGQLDSDNSYHVVTGSYTGTTAVLDGFTITAGYAHSTGGTPDDRGGGMDIDEGDPTISNCRFSGNSAAWVGGGMDNSGNPQLTNCEFSGNTADYAGGIFNAGNLILDSCTFSQNTAEYFGGAIRSNSASLTVIDCVFTGNVGNTSTGGAVANQSTSASFENCTFIGNTAFTNGGAMENAASSTTLTDCTFSDNSAGNFGGGIYNGNNSDATLTGCTFIGNSATTSGGGVCSSDSTCTISDGIFVEHPVGGAVQGRSSGHLDLANLVIVASWPAVYVWPSTTSVDMVGCTIVGSEASGNGAAVYFDSGNGTVTNTLIVGNVAGASGAGVRIRLSAFATITNCTIAGNQAGGIAGGIWVDSATGALDVVNSILWQNSDGGGSNTGESAQITSDPGSLTISFCDVQDDDPLSGNIIDGVNNNIVADPLFLGGPSGTWTADATYDPTIGQATLIDGNASFTVDELAGKFLNPDTSQARQSLIVSNTAIEIVIWGDFAAEGTTGATYQINDYHVQAGSPCTDQGLNTPGGGPLPAVDLDLNARRVDDPASADCVTSPGTCGTAPIVDMGSYEFGSTAFGGILHVDPDADGGAEMGYDWANAYVSLQDALSAAGQSGGAVTQVWVAAGSYMPDGGVLDSGGGVVRTGSGARTATFQLLSGVAIYGGFPTGGGDGTFEARDPDPETNDTILSGDIGTPGDTADNSYHVTTGSGTGNTAVLDGFTISDGNAAGASLVQGGEWSMTQVARKSLTASSDRTRRWPAAGCTT